MTTSQIAIRIARQADHADLWRVATLDGAGVPARPLLVAEADGEIVAALSLGDGAVIADPFHRTAAAVDLLRMRAAQVRREDAPRRRYGPLGRIRARAAALPAH